jgi:hypothetical protein
MSATLGLKRRGGRFSERAGADRASSSRLAPLPTEAPEASRSGGENVVHGERRTSGSWFRFRSLGVCVFHPPWPAFLKNPFVSSYLIVTVE